MAKTKSKPLSEMSTDEIAALPREEYIRLSVKEYMNNPRPPVQWKRGKPIFHDEKDVDAAIKKAKGLTK